MGNWRPEGWKGLETVADPAWEEVDKALYEAGADAMLEALKAIGIRVKVDGPGAEGNNPAYTRDTEGYGTLFWAHWSKKLGLNRGVTGRLVFIPDIEADIVEGKDE